MTGTKLFIGNLPDAADKEELEAMFKKFGKVVEFDILKDYGFVHYENESEAKAAVDALDGQVHKGTNIRVEVSRSRVRQKAGMGGKGECFRCGGEGHWSKECPKGPSRPGEGRGRSGRGRYGRYDPYGRDPYYPDFPDPYEYYASMRAYDRYRLDYARRMRMAPLRDELYRDFSDRPSSADYDYDRTASPSRDPYYDFYERRRLATMDAYRARARSQADTAPSYPSTSYPASSNDPPAPRRPMQARVPGPY